MSAKTLFAALEEFTDEVTSEITNEQPTDGDFGAETAGIDFPQEAGDIDSDLAQLTCAAQGMEDIISLVQEAPGEGCQPLQPFVEKAVNVALESNDMVAEAGNPLDGSKDKTKDGVVNKLKEFAQKIWNMLSNFAKKIGQWVREIWAQYTNRIVKNANRAKQILEEVKSLEAKADAQITDRGLLGRLAAAGNLNVGQVMTNVMEYTSGQAHKGAPALFREARECVTAVSSGKEVAPAVMERFLKALADGAGFYQDEANAEQAKTIGAAEGVTVHMSAPFFGGYRAWVAVPQNAEQLTKWNHGLSKVDEVKAAESAEAPDAAGIKTIAEYVANFGKIISFYQGSLKDLDALNADLNKAAKAAGTAGVKDGTDRKYLQTMQAVIPRIIKGPQVAAYAYAANASTLALQYCEAAIRAHRGESTVGEKAGHAADKVSAAAAGAKDKVKNAFAKKGE